jgi:catechol 2,3-dioxygenase-like lactoylglutathione lyase family enzyme
MKTIDKLLMFHMAVSDMDQSKAFYLDKLGFQAPQEVELPNPLYINERTT